MATEIKNNGNKLARWTVESILSGADLIRFGFVSRVNPRDRTRHAILGVTSFKPTEFSSQMNLSIGNGWGIVRTIVDICYKLPDGKYVLVKDPNKVKKSDKCVCVWDIDNTDHPWTRKKEEESSLTTLSLSLSLGHITTVFCTSQHI